MAFYTEEAANRYAKALGGEWRVVQSHRPFGAKTVREHQPTRTISEPTPDVVPVQVQEVEVTAGWREAIPNLSVRVRKALAWVGAVTVEDITRTSAAQWRAVPNFGARSFKELRDRLAMHGLTLAD